MDTRMIDVAIGLALVFALTSLLVTAMQEVYSSWRKLRGRVLHQAIVSFLGDDADFAKKLLEHPLLVSLAPETKGQHDARRPSYVGADTLVSALIGTLVRDQPGGFRPDTPLQFVEAVQSQAAGAAVGSGPGAEFVRGLTALAAGVERDWPAFEARVGAWFDAVAERSGGWFKRKTQVGVFVIGLGVAAVVNINPIVVASRLWTDEPLRKAVASAAERVSASYADAASAASAASASASGSVPALVRATAPAPAASAAVQPPAVASPLSAVQDAHTALMTALDRAAQRARTITAERPVVQALALDALRFERELPGWRTAGGAAADAATLRLDEIARRMLATLGDGPDPAGLRAPLQRVADASAAAARAPVAAPLPVAATQPAERAASKPDGIVACGKGIPSDPALDQLCLRLDQLGALQQAGLPIGWSASARPRVFDDGCPKDELRCQPTLPITNLAWLGNLLLIPAGWLLTALACTLGAPFWFDALGKLVRLRGSGGKPPEPSTVGDKPQGSGMLVRSAGPGTPGAGAASPGVGPVVPMSDALNDAERLLTVAEVQRVQRGLGLSETEASGFFDGTTRRAIFAWQERQGLLPATGELSETQLRELLAMRGGPAASGSAAAAPVVATAGVPAPTTDEHADGCDVPITESTPDEMLPAARGGVAPDDGA